MPPLPGCTTAYTLASSLLSLVGVRGLYYGLPIMIVQSGGKVGIRFTSFDAIKSMLRPENGCVTAAAVGGDGDGDGGSDSVVVTMMVFTCVSV